MLKLLIYCHWLWIWTFLFLFNIIKYSPLISLIPAFLFTLINNFFNKKNEVLNIYLKSTIVIFEAVLVILVYLKQSYILLIDIPINITLFIIYLLVLRYNGLTFNKIYFELLPKKAKKHKTVKQYLKATINSKL